MSLAGGVVQFSSAEHGEPDNVRPLLEWEGLDRSRARPQMNSSFPSSTKMKMEDRLNM